MVYVWLLMATATLSLAACGANYDAEGARSLPNQAAEFHRALQVDYAAHAST